MTGKAPILDDELLRPEEVAERLRVTQNYLGQLRFRGEGPAFIKRGRVIRYRRTEIERWLEAGVTGDDRQRAGA